MTVPSWNEMLIVGEGGYACRLHCLFSLYVFMLCVFACGDTIVWKAWGKLLYTYLTQGGTQSKELPYFFYISAFFCYTAAASYLISSFVVAESNLYAFTSS